MANSQITDFLTGLGYAPDDAIYIRLLPAKGFNPDSSEHRALFPKLAYEREHRNGAKAWVPSNKNLKLHDGALIWQCKKGDRPIKCSDPWKWIQAQSQEGFCPYIVVNPGGQNKKEITTGRVAFWEHDELDKPTQIERFMEYADRWGGAMAVETRSSIHCYIRLDQELPPNLIQPTLKRVIALMGSDPSVNDECRLMRIPGFDHIKMVDTPSGWQTERFPITLLHSWDGTFASWDEIDRELPTEAPKPEPKPAPKPSTLSTVSDAGIGEILANDILPRLSVEQIFSWTGHDFQEDSSGKLKGNCPWHDSQSGTSFWVTPSQDGGTHTGACPTCTDNKKLNPIAYRYALRTNNPQAGQPTGRDFIEVVKELAADAGVQLPAYQPDRVKAIDSAPRPPGEELWDCLSSHNLQLGRWHFPKEGEPSFVPQTSFDLEISKILEDFTGGGIEFEVKWLELSTVRTRRALVKTAEMLTVKDFITALTRGVKTHLTAKFKPGDLADLIQNRKTQYTRAGGVVYRLADRTGQQDDGVWAFENAQFKPDGTPTTEQESRWMFNQSLGELEKVPSPTIAPQNPEALGNLARAVEGFFHAETVPLAWFVCGYTTATMQRQTVMKQDHAFPQLNVFGDAGGGKTTAAKVGASLIGMHGDRSIITRFSESLIYEQVKSLGGVPLILDDPVKKGMKQESRDAVDNFLWSMYNGVSRRVRGNEQTPNTNVIVTSNVALGEGSQAIESRLLKMHFPVRPVNEAGFPALEKAMGEATGGLSQLLAIQYGREAVREIRSRLLEHLTGSHSRISLSMALLVYFTQKFCDVAGVNFDAFDYAVKHLCPTANDFESDKDSLTDFLEKLAIMRSEGLVGEWNLVQDKAGDLAIHLPGIWGGFQSRFNPNYSQQSLEQLIEGRGGAKGAVRRFVGTKQECVDYRKAVNVWEMQASEARGPAAPKKTENRKSIIVPRTIAAAAGFSSDCGESDENLPTIDAPAPTNDPTLESLVKPPGMGRIIPQPTTPVVFTSPLPVGTWEADGPDPWAESDLDDARISIQNNPTAEDNFKPLIPRSQWKQVGIKEDERCAA